MKGIARSITLFTLVAAFASFSQAQTSQYQNPKKKKKAAASSVAPKSSTTPTADATAAAPANGEKVDIQQIENQYWQQKDTEFHVVQSRRFTKDHRWFLSGGYSDLINDSFTRGGAFDLSGGYYFTEQKGIEVEYSSYSVQNSKTTSDIFGLGGAPAYNKMTDEIAVTYNWMPIYGKVSVMDKTIIYYDLGLRLGAGLAQYQHVLQNGNQSASSPMLVADITQQFFLNEKWALRVDVKDRYFQDKRIKYNNTSTTYSDSTFETSAMIGVIYYFGSTNNQNK